MKNYKIKEIFKSIQGEGLHSGTQTVFVRFSGCNRSCNILSTGFDCDTDHLGGKDYTLDMLIKEVLCEAGRCRRVTFTGGEPTLQLDGDIIWALKEKGFFLAIETNGEIPCPQGLDWITVSPKGGQLLQNKANELKVVISTQTEMPIDYDAEHFYLMPRDDGKGLDLHALKHCLEIIEKEPRWKLCLQIHKIINVR
jgi:organic radical activating enzyme